MAHMTSSVRLHQFPNSSRWDWRCYLCDDDGHAATRKLGYMAVIEHLKSLHGAADLWLIEPGNGLSDPSLHGG